jgi:lipoprotein-anchoring transpeptidase ErfK/SrfK
MTELPPEAKKALEEAHRALSRGDRAEAKRLARRAASIAPGHEQPWLYLAAASSPRAGLAYLVRALEINPRSKPAKKAIRWIIRQLPPQERQAVSETYSLPRNLTVKFAPVEAFTNHRLFSFKAVLPAILIVLGVGLWFNGQTAVAREPNSISAPVAKASWTPTATFTPTPTPTFTPSPTPTATPTFTPTNTRTPRPAVSFNFSTDPSELADEGRWIDIDLANQRVYAYEGETIVREFVVSTGTWRYPTVTGQFRIYVKYPSTPMAGPGYYLPGVPFTMYFYKGYAIHGTYWHSNFGTPMSHGCVNLKTPEAEWLYNFASVGTLVNIHP